MKTFSTLLFVLFFVISCDKKTTSTENKMIQNSESETQSENELSENQETSEETNENEANYTEFLTNALNAAKNKNQKDFVSNMKYFSTAIEDDNITPENLSEKNRNLYTKCLYEALINEIEIPDDFGKQAIVFLNYERESHPENIFSLGRLYDYGWGVKQDYQKAAELYLEAAEKGHARAMYNIGNMYMQGDGVKQDYAQTKYWYEKGAAKGDDASLQGMGLLYHYGRGVNKDEKKAVDWYLKAADKGNKTAIRNMSGFNSEKVFNWFKKNESKGDKDFLAYLANMYQNGRGTSKNTTLAQQYFQKAANLGNPHAQYMVGYNYDEGYGGLDFNWKKAVEWYKKSANQNNYAAMQKLGEFYYFGVGGLKQDIPKAKELFTKAKDGKIINAEIALKAIEDIETGAYYTHDDSQYGNRIYLEESDMQIFYKKMPVVMNKFGSRWTIPVHFYNNSGGNLQIWPAQIKENRPDDYVYFSNYTPSPAYSNGTGVHDVGISQEKEWGIRNIGYTYITGHFQNEKLTIKVPTAVCWKPQNEY